MGLGKLSQSHLSLWHEEEPMDLDKLLEIGDRCINEEPPACTAHCPVHLDVKSFVEEIEKREKGIQNYGKENSISTNNRYDMR